MEIIEFMGMPRSGLGTQVHRIQKRYEKLGARVVCFSAHERMPIIHTPRSEQSMFNLMHGAYAVEAYHACLQAKQTPDILLLDRGWNDMLVWSYFRYFYGNSSSEEHRALTNLFSSYARLVEHTLHFSLPPLDALFRYTWGEALCGEINNIQSLERLHYAYESQEKLLHNLRRIDGMKDPDTITEEIVALLKL